MRLAPQTGRAGLTKRGDRQGNPLPAGAGYPGGAGGL